MVGSGSGDRGCESPHRPHHAAFRPSLNRAGARVGRVTLSTAGQNLQATPSLSNCPDCSGSLTVLRIIPGRAGAEYWTKRCTRCGGIHLDIVKPSSARSDEARA
jgi:hypothetical protein